MAISHGWLCSDCDAHSRGPQYLPLLRREAGDGYDDKLFDILEKLEPRSFWFRGRNDLILWALHRYFSDARDLLEIGCGTGFVLAAIHRARPELGVVGAELFPPGLAVARRRLAGVPLVQLDARDLRVRSAFDVVAMLDVLEHIREDDQVLAEAARALRPGGGLLLTVPQHPRLWSAADVFAEHERRYRRTELVAKVERAGFRVVRASSFVSLLLPFLAASRLRGARDIASYDFEREFRLPRALDRAFEYVLRVERVLIARGVSFRAGGSLLLVARKV